MMYHYLFSGRGKASWIWTIQHPCLCRPGTDVVGCGRKGHIRKVGSSSADDAVVEAGQDVMIMLFEGIYLQ